MARVKCFITLAVDISKAEAGVAVRSEKLDADIMGSENV